MLYQLILFNSFSDFFSSPTNPTNYNNINYRIFGTFTGGIWIQNSNFYNLISANGSVLFILNQNVIMVFETSFIFNCLTTQNYGAIFFQSTISNGVVLSKICTIKAGGPHNHGQFCDLRVSLNKKNQILFCSYSLCSYFTQTQYSSLSFFSTSPLIKNLNSSYNNCQYNTILSSYLSNTTISYSIFYSNFASHGGLFRFRGGNSYLSYSNIINNTNNGDYYIIFQEELAFYKFNF